VAWLLYKLFLFIAVPIKFLNYSLFLFKLKIIWAA